MNRRRSVIQAVFAFAILVAWAQSAQAASILSGPVVNPSNGHTYYLLTSDFWEASEAAAITLGGHLVTINDQAENDWVFDTFALFGGASRTLWIGYHRLEPGGPFVWASGEVPGFENWFPGEPNNGNGAENYAAFVPPEQDPGGKKWFDMFASTTYSSSVISTGVQFTNPIHGVVEVPGATVVAIDIKPGSDTNSINLSAAGVVPVGILSSETFDATRVDPASVSLAGATVKLIGKSSKYACSAEDVNGDALLDLVCHVMTADFLIEPGDSIAVLEATTFSGQAIRGQDSIRIVPD